MLIPRLPPRVEQRHNLAGPRINGFNLGALILVAASAGQPKVFFIGGTAAGAGDNVLDGKGLTDDP